MLPTAVHREGTATSQSASQPARSMAGDMGYQPELDASTDSHTRTPVYISARGEIGSESHARAHCGAASSYLWADSANYAATGISAMIADTGVLPIMLSFMLPCCAMSVRIHCDVVRHAC